MYCKQQWDAKNPRRNKHGLIKRPCRIGILSLSTCRASAGNQGAAMACPHTGKLEAGFINHWAQQPVQLYSSVQQWQNMYQTPEEHKNDAYASVQIIPGSLAKNKKTWSTVMSCCSPHVPGSICIAFKCTPGGGRAEEWWWPDLRKRRGKAGTPGGSLLLPALGTSKWAALPRWLILDRASYG